MSAILAVIEIKGRPLDAQLLARMLATLAPRGPDGCTEWRAGPVGLGQAQLSTRPVQGHVSGLVAASDGLAISCDARLDQRAALGAQLGLPEPILDSLSDAELILHAYRRWDTGCVRHLEGDFAFALWDGPRQRLFAGRDAFGVKPCYYTHTSECFCLASEIKALLAHPAVPRHLNESRVADYLGRLFDDPVETFFAGILRLPPAHYLVYEGSRLRVARYWRLDARRELRLDSLEAYAAAFREQLTRAVAARLGSAPDTGLALSGGLDSSSIAMTARQVLGPGQPLDAFAGVFPQWPSVERLNLDESPYIEAVLTRGDFSLHKVPVPRSQLFAGLDQMFAFSDEPYFAPQIEMHARLYQAVQEHGKRTYLEGMDGDVTVSHGWERLPQLALSGQWRLAWRETRAALEKHAEGMNFRQAAWRYVLRPLVPPAWLGRRRRNRHLWLPPEEFLTPDFYRKSGVSNRLQQERQRNYRLTARPRYRHRANLEMGSNTLALELLDKLAARTRIELRYPFFDRQLASFCLSLPASLKLSQGWNRWILRQSMADILPEAVCWRTNKADFSALLIAGLHSIGREERAKVLESTQEILAPYIQPHILEAVYRRFYTTPHVPLEAAEGLYAALSLSRWLTQTGFTNETPAVEKSFLTTLG